MEGVQDSGKPTHRVGDNGQAPASVVHPNNDAGLHGSSPEH